MGRKKWKGQSYHVYFMCRPLLGSFYRVYSGGRVHLCSATFDLVLLLHRRQYDRLTVLPKYIFRYV